jgi:hypothetical protein
VSKPHGYDAQAVANIINALAKVFFSSLEFSSAQVYQP